MGTGGCCCCDCGCSPTLPPVVATSEDGGSSSVWPHRPRAHCPTRSSMERPTATGVSEPTLPCPVRSCRTRSISAAVLPAGCCCSCSVKATAGPGPGPYGGRKRCQGGSPDRAAASVGRCRLRRRVGEEEVAGFEAATAVAGSRRPAPSPPSWWASRSRRRAAVISLSATIACTAIHCCCRSWFCDCCACDCDD